MRSNLNPRFLVKGVGYVACFYWTTIHFYKCLEVLAIHLRIYNGSDRTHLMDSIGCVTSFQVFDEN